MRMPWRILSDLGSVYGVVEFLDPRRCQRRVQRFISRSVDFVENAGRDILGRGSPREMGGNGKGHDGGGLDALHVSLAFCHHVGPWPHISSHRYDSHFSR